MTRIYKTAISPLDKENRLELLKIVSPKMWLSEIVNCLIGDSSELYEALLKDKNKKDLHLLPLHGFKGDTIGDETWKEESWITKAKVALDAGYTPANIENAVFSPSWSWSGNMSDMWKLWLTRYDRLLSNADPRIREIGEIGKAKALKNLERELKEERREAVYGYD